ncbi:MAG: PKD domain-containing protein [Bacteroidota bacterium]
MKRLLLLIFLFLNYYSSGQGNMISISSTVPANLTVCGAAKLFTVNVYNPSPFLITQDTLLITVPTGIQFVSGSLTGGTFLNDFGGIIKVFLPNIPALTNLNITFMASAQCTVVAFIAGGGITKNNIRVNYTANNNHTYNTHNSSLYLVKQPFLTITTVTNQSYTGNIGDVFTRCITVVNAGSGELTDFTFTDIHGPGIQITASDKGVLTNIGMTAKIILNGTAFLSIGDGDNLFESGESITICETVTVLNCISASSAFKAFWGCSVNACQSTVSSANVLFPNYLPILLITPISSMNSCIGAGNASPQQLKIINKGLGNAINVQLEIFQATGGGYNATVGSNIDPASFTIQTGINASPVSITPNSTVATNALGCMTNPKGKVLFTLPLINAGDTIYLKWNSYSCCPNSCTNTGQNYINGWRYKGSYQNICQNTYVIAEGWGRVHSQIYGALVNDGSPSTLTNGQTGTFNFLFSNYTNSYPIGPGAYWKFEFTLPPFACLSYSNIRILHFNGVSTWTPNTVTASGNTVTAIFNAPPPFGLNQAELKINLTLSCGLCTGIDSLSAITVKSIYVPNNTCACEIGVSCQSAALSVICPDPCPAGVFFNNFEIKRTSYGLPDNEAGGGNGLADGAGSLNFTKIKTNRSMFGDTITAGYTGIVNTSFAHPSLQYCYAYSSISNGNLLSFLDAQLFIYRGGSLLYTCTSFTPVVTTTGTTRKFFYDLSAPTLIASGCLPGGFTNTDGDSLIFKPRYKVTVNPGNSILNCYATNKFYSSDIANPTLAADKYQCSNFNGNFTVIGYFYHSYGADSYYVNSCDNISVSQNYYLSIGPADDNYAGGNLFPYEYRNWAHISTLAAALPPGYTYISARFNQIRTAGTLASNTSPWETILPVDPNADTLVFDVEPYFLGGTIPLSDDGFHGKLEVIIQPSCEVTPTISQGIQYDWTFEPTTYLTGPGSEPTFETGSDQIIYDPPVLFLQSVLPSIFALDSTTSWDISISNTSNISDALNTWISGPTISGVAITQVVDLDNNVVIPLTDTIYKVGTVSAGDISHFRITASFISCGPDSVIIHSGWNCNAGYPTGVGTYPCVPKKITLTLTPLTPAFLINSEGPSASIQLCDTAEFTAEGVNVQLGTAYNVILKATLPVGATLIPGSSQFSYPVSDPSISIPDPTLISGNEWKWDITATDSVIGANGLKGILDTTLNSFRVSFKFITDCSYTSGSSVAFVVTGNAACGYATEPDISLSPSLDIIGATEPYSTAVILSTTYVSPCAGNSSIRVVIHNQGPTAFGVTDSVVVQLPIGVPFISGSFSGIYNAPLNGTPRQYSVNGITYLVWKLPIGTLAGDSCIFSFEYIGDPPALACGIILFEAKTYSISTITCVATGNNCVTQIITGDTTLPVFTYKAYLSLSNGFATAIPNPPGGETVTISYDITNTGQAILTDADSIVQFYFDANADGIYSTGDVFIAEDTLLIPKDSTMRFTSVFNAPAGQGCSIIALIDPAVNSCVCDFSQLLITSSLHSLDNDSTLCSGETITLSSVPVTGYTYSWTPVTGLSDPAISNAVLTTSNLTTAPVATSYILTTNRMGCIAADTLVITVNPLPIGTITGTIDVCENSGAPNVTFVGSGSTGPYTFTYNINGGSNQTLTTTNGDSAFILAPTNVPGTFVYNLVSIQDSSSTACAQPQSASVTIIVNPLPLASALIGGTTAVCKGGASPNITFTGSVGTPPFTFTYTINNGSLLTATTISGNSIIVSAPTSTVGIFIYNLLSVQDASSTTCSQPQSGSATITVNPLPTATISGSIAVCREATAPDITFVGSNGTAPYTFTYTLNGGANQTVVSTNGDTAFVQASTVVDGTFVFTLVSVIDASITTCSQAQSGTATVIVDPLPTATIRGTTSLCQGFPAPDITFVGFGGVRPYIFTFTINGVVQPTVVATGIDSVTLPAPTTVAGIFTYALVSVQDANLAACTHPQTGNAIVTVHPKPIAAFASTKICNGNATQFNDSSTTLSGTITSWVWDMGDGSPLNNAQSPFYIYPAAGMHSVTLLVNNSFGCADTVVKTAQVYYNPIASFTHNNVCFRDTIHFTNTSTVDFSTSITSHLWVFGDGGVTSNLISPVHYYSVPGTFNVTLVTTTGNGCSAVANIPVKTFDPPVTGFSFNNTCLFDSVLFTNTSVNPTMGTIASWSWNFGDNSPLNTSTWSPNHLYPNPGDYEVTLITHSSNLGCPDTLHDSITVFPMPIADFGSANVCLNEVMYFNDSSIVASGSISAWEWNFGDGTPLVNSQNPSHTFTTATTYSVSLIATSIDGCKDTVAKNVVVHPLPNVQFSTANVCDGTAVSFTDLSTIPATDTILSYSWAFGDNSLVSTNKNTSHLYASAGSYNVELTVVSYFGCVDSTIKTSIVNPNPVVNFTVNDTAGCEPFCIVFQDSSAISTGTNIGWSWDFGNGTQANNSENSVCCYSNDSVFVPVFYTPILTVTSDSGCVSMISKTNFITVYPKPDADFNVEPKTETIINPVITFTDLSTGTNFWNWNFGDMDTSSLSAPPPHTYADTGTYTITLITNTNYGCLDTAYQNISIEPDFVFYIPNSFTPDDDGINETFSGKGIFIIKYEMSIFDRWGNLVFFSDDINTPWDGKANHGKDLAQRDVYIYSINVTDIKTIQHAYKGKVTLIR